VTIFGFLRYDKAAQNYEIINPFAISVGGGKEDFLIYLKEKISNL
jgi:hypothetical protein